MEKVVDAANFAAHAWRWPQAVPSLKTRAIGRKVCASKD
jgi:hypothetical protein